MKQTILLLLIFSITFSLKSQSIQEIVTTEIGYFVDTNFVWSGWEVSMELEKKIALIKEINQNKFLRYPIENLDNYIEFFHIIDFNMDGMLDIVFYGNPGGAESTYVIFIEKTKDGFQETYRSAGRLLSVSEYDGYTGMGFTIYNYGCCASMVDHLYKIAPINTPNGFSYQVQSDVAFYSGMDKPTKIFDKQIRFKTINDKYSLRASPEINSDEEAYYGLTNGNIIATFPKSSKGIAIAESTDETGRVWWLVIMSNKNKPIDSNMYSGYHQIENYKIAGWMSSRYLDY